MQVTLDEKIFTDCLGRLLAIVYQNDHKSSKDSYFSGSEKFSFRKGFFKTEEGYKRDIIRNTNTFKRKDFIVGLKKSECLVDYLEQRIGKNNILDWRNANIKYKIEQNREESENLMLDILLGNGNDEFLFEEATKLWGKWYPFITYLFFLRDSAEFVPVRPEKFKKCFTKLGISTTCLDECSWKNYNTFLDFLYLIQDKLQDSGFFKEKVELIDAHSFVWMLWLLDENNDKANESYTVNKNETEGNRINFYGTRYERSKINRDNAIRKYGYKCAVCNFDFKETYGELGENFIEVHHIKPLSMYNGKEQEISIDDLICLCPNCHRMIHRKKGEILTPDELKNIINSTANAELEKGYTDMLNGNTIPVEQVFEELHRK